jgi:hypothetical protein
VEEALKEYFFKNLGENMQEAYLPVGCGFVGGFAGFQDEDYRHHRPLHRELSYEHGCIKKLCEVFGCRGRLFLKDFPCNEVISRGTFRFKVIDDGLYLRSS